MWLDEEILASASGASQRTTKEVPGSARWRYVPGHLWREVLMLHTRTLLIALALLVSGAALVALQPVPMLQADPKPFVCNGVPCRPNEVCCIVACPPNDAPVCTARAGKGVCPPLPACPAPVNPPGSSQN
jgi:hypothetical protein